MVCSHFGLHSGRRLRNTKVYPCKLTKSTWAAMLFNTQAYTCRPTGLQGFVIALWPVDVHVCKALSTRLELRGTRNSRT